MCGYDKARMLSKDPLNAFDIIIRKSLHLHTVTYLCIKKRKRNKYEKTSMTSIQDISNLLEFLLRKIRLIWLTLSTTIPLQ